MDMANAEGSARTSQSAMPDPVTTQDPLAQIDGKRNRRESQEPVVHSDIILEARENLTRGKATQHRQKSQKNRNS